MSTDPIRALFVVPSLRVGGAEQHVTTLLSRMDPARFTPSLICVGEQGALFQVLPPAGIDAKALYLGKRQAVRAVRELVAEMRRTRPDVVVVNGYSAETVGRIAARIAGVKHVIMWVHNATNIQPRGQVRITIDRVLNRWTNRYFGVAEAQRPYLTEDLGYPDNKIRIIHNGVDLTQFGGATDRGVLAEFGFGDDDPVVAIIAAFREEKDHFTFLHAARHVVDEMPNAKFLIVGDGPMRGRLEDLCSELRLTPNVCFAGWRGDVARLLPAIDVFVLCSVTECFPISLLEAMASARPAVCTGVGGIPELIDDGVTGYLVPPKDSRALAAKLLCLLSDPQTADRMGRAARSRVEAEFDLDRSIAKAQQEIEDLVNGRGVANARQNSEAQH